MARVGRLNSMPTIDANPHRSRPRRPNSSRRTSSTYMQIQKSQPLLITVTCLSISPRVGAWCGFLGRGTLRTPSPCSSRSPASRSRPAWGVVRIPWTRHAQNSQPLLITVTCLSISPRVGAWCGFLGRGTLRTPSPCSSRSPPLLSLLVRFRTHIVIACVSNG